MGRNNQRSDRIFSFQASFSRFASWSPSIAQVRAGRESRLAGNGAGARGSLAVDKKVELFCIFFCPLRGGQWLR